MRASPSPPPPPPTSAPALSAAGPESRLGRALKQLSGSLRSLRAGRAHREREGQPAEDQKEVNRPDGERPDDERPGDERPGDETEHGPAPGRTTPDGDRQPPQARPDAADRWAQVETLLGRLLGEDMSTDQAVAMLLHTLDIGLGLLETDPDRTDDTSKKRRQICTAVLATAQLLKEQLRAAGQQDAVAAAALWQYRRPHFSNGLYLIEHAKLLATGAAASPSAPLSRSEQVLLLESSRLNGLKFPPWALLPAARDGSNGSKPGLLSSPPAATTAGSVDLSASQRREFAGFRRARDALGSRDDDHAGMKQLAKSCFVQDLLPDCSLVASLIVLADWRERAERRQPPHDLARIDVLRNIFGAEYDLVARCPIASKEGQYTLTLCFNGAARRVPVDDLLPTSTGKRGLHVTDIQNRTLQWPALVEKAYLSVRGGYARFAGSCPATDLSVLSGWIPEQIHLQRDYGSFSPDAAWARVFAGFHQGRVMVTLGTAAVEEGAHLERWHTYAVVGMEEDEEEHGRLRRRRLLVRNPLGRVVGGELAAEGARWMEFDHVALHFDSLYLNWDPAPFHKLAERHFKWDFVSPSPAERDEFSLASNPQFLLSPTSAAGWKGEVWILLTRHFQTNRVALEQAESEPSLQQGNSKTAIDLLPGYIALLLLSSSSATVFDASKFTTLGRSRYVDTPFCLLRIDTAALIAAGTAGSADPLTLVLSQQDLALGTHRFSMAVYSDQPMQLHVGDPVRTHPHDVSVPGRWGGTNPVGFDVTVHSAADSAGRATGKPAGQVRPIFLLEDGGGGGPSPKLVNIKLLSPGCSLSAGDLSPAHVLADSGKYSPRYCYVQGPWELASSTTSGGGGGGGSSNSSSASSVSSGPVRYQLLASTYNQDPAGTFTLRCLSAERVTIVPSRQHLLAPAARLEEGQGGQAAAAPPLTSRGRYVYQLPQYSSSSSSFVAFPRPAAGVDLARGGGRIFGRLPIFVRGYARASFSGAVLVSADSADSDSAAAGLRVELELAVLEGSATPTVLAAHPLSVLADPVKPARRPFEMPDVDLWAAAGSGGGQAGEQTPAYVLELRMSGGAASKGPAAVSVELVALVETGARENVRFGSWTGA